MLQINIILNTNNAFFNVMCVVKKINRLKEKKNPKEIHNMLYYFMNYSDLKWGLCEKSP